MTDARDRRLERRALAWLLFLGPLFFASYAWANGRAAARPSVGSIVFEWERFIPFLPWTIIPYWSIDLLYAVSLFACTRRAELDRQGLRLLTAQGISIACFVAFPLRFTGQRPPAAGIAGFLFDRLTAFDQPFNQAPSLHISLLVVIWTRLAAHWPPRLRPFRPLFHTWMALIGLSVLTTYQHHFFDLPTGLLAGFACLWLWPEEGPTPWAGAAWARQPPRRRQAALYLGGAGICAGLAAIGYGGWLWWIWPAVTLAAVAAMYAFFGEGGFQKGSDGRLSMAARWLLAPYLAAAKINALVWTWGGEAADPVRDGVSLGCFPAARELAAAGIAGVVDLAAEMDVRPGPVGYVSIPVLDLTVPAPAKLRAAAAAIEALRARGPVRVCCALGFSRSAAAVATWLVATGRAASPAEAAAIVRRARPGVALSPAHLDAIADAARGDFP